MTDLLNLMDSSGTDYTNLFRSLSEFQQESPNGNAEIRDHFLHREAFDDWALRYQERLQAEKSQDTERQARNESNESEIRAP